MNPFAESWVGSIKQECLDHFMVFGEEHLKYLIDEYVAPLSRGTTASGVGQPFARRIGTAAGNQTFLCGRDCLP